MPLFLIPNAANLTGDTLAAGVTASSLTSVGTLTALTVSGQASFADGSAAAPSVKIGDEQNGLYSDGAGSLSFATAGARVVRMGTAGDARNYLRLDANNTPLITAVAGATNADIGLASAGTGAIFLATNGSINNLQARVSHVASAVNYWDFTGAPTGSGIRVDATGSDSGVNGFFVAKGSGVWNFCTSGSSGNRQFQIGHIASAVNYGQVTGSATGSPPIFSVAGTDANISILNDTKGTGSHFFRTNGGAQTQLEVVHVASAVNRLQIGGSATAGSPYLIAAGSDTNINIYYGAKGSGSHAFASGAGLIQFQVNHTASAVNYAQITGSATGNAVTTSASGSDSNIDFAIAPKGTGVLRFGTHSAIAAETVTGYITIKDSAGNTRKLAVLS